MQNQSKSLDDSTTLLAVSADSRGSKYVLLTHIGMFLAVNFARRAMWPNERRHPAARGSLGHKSGVPRLGNDTLWDARLPIQV